MRGQGGAGGQGRVKGLARLWRRVAGRRSPPAKAVKAAEEREADVTDPAVALALRILADAGPLASDDAAEAELALAREEYAAAPAEERPALLRRVGQLSMRQAVARQARKKFDPTD